MPTLSEETMLLLYTHVQPAGSTDEYDTFSCYGGEIRLLAGTALMDLSLLGMVQVRPVSRATRRLLAASRTLFMLLILAVFFVLPLYAPVYSIPLPHWLSPSAAFTLGLFVVVLVVALVGWALGRVVGDNLTILDRTPAGDVVLNEALERSARPLPVVR